MAGKAERLAQVAILAAALGRKARRAGLHSTAIIDDLIAPKLSLRRSSSPFPLVCCSTCGISMLTHSYAQRGLHGLFAGTGCCCGRQDRSTILRAIRTGRLSAERDEANGSWAIQPAELLRVYPVAEAHVDQHGDDQGRSTDATAELRELRTRIADKDALIAAHERALDDLRHLLDEERIPLAKSLAGCVRLP
jgi:hypothetical protein